MSRKPPAMSSTATAARKERAEEGDAVVKPIANRSS